MCRALKVLCAAPTPERLAELKRATVSAHWELVGGAVTATELNAQVVEWAPHAVVFDAALGAAAASAVRELLPSVRLIAVGGGSPATLSADAVCALDGIREAILGLPPVGGPVRS